MPKNSQMMRIGSKAGSRALMAEGLSSKEEAEGFVILGVKLGVAV